MDAKYNSLADKLANGGEEAINSNADIIAEAANTQDVESYNRVFEKIKGIFNKGKLIEVKNEGQIQTRRAVYDLKDFYNLLDLPYQKEVLTVYLYEGKKYVRVKSRGKGILSKMEPESKVIPVVVLAHWDLENQEVVLPWLLQKGVEVVTLPDNSHPGIPQLADILVKYFGQSKEKEESNEMESSATVQETSN